MQILEELAARKILKAITNEAKFKQLPLGVGVYIGFDPTAESLHVGNYIQIALLLRFKQAGFKPIAVLGGATGMIGDPSGKSAERQLLAPAELQANKLAIKKQLQNFGLTVVDNYDFYKDLNVLTFLKKAGKLININYMLAKEVVANRLESGISFTEFAYQLIQGWDFKCLYEKYNVRIQVGGSDQWGNITTGIEVIRKTQGENHQAVGLTSNLLLTKSGKKFGKSANNAIWLDQSKTSAFELYQYFFNTPDIDLATLFNWLTFLDLESIASILEKHQSNPKAQSAHHRLAYELVKDIHSETLAKQVQRLTQALFASKDKPLFLSDQDVMQLEQALPTFKNITGNILEVLTKMAVVSSYRAAKELVQAQAISINGKIITDCDYVLSSAQHNLLKKGKKQYYLLKQKA